MTNPDQPVVLNNSRVLELLIKGLAWWAGVVVLIVNCADLVLGDSPWQVRLFDLGVVVVVPFLLRTGWRDIAGRQL